MIHIFLDVLYKNPHASFFFIGAEDERDLSLYILANKGYVTDMGSYVRRIEQAVRKALA